MKTRTFMEFLTLGKKRYVLIALLLLLIAFSGMIPLICIIFTIILLPDHGTGINFGVMCIWLAIAIWCLSRLSEYRDRFVKGELDLIFGDNLPS